MLESWDDFWTSFLQKKRLEQYIESMNSVEVPDTVKNICYEIYSDYDSFCNDLDKIRINLIQDVEKLPGVHLITSRVKSIESLLEKVIKKRYDGLFDKSNLYSRITGKDYKNVLTDLIGIRLILSYRGDWKTLHGAILEKFPLKNNNEYREHFFIPHEENKIFIAEKPCAYYAYDDDLSIYEGEFINTKLKESGYRSVHYIVSYHGVYVELQARTIYDEAWSDCDHSYVYKQDSNPSYDALHRLSKILCEYTNSSNDLGELMRLIYKNYPILDMEDGIHYKTQRKTIAKIDHIIGRFKNTLDTFIDFRQNLCEEEEGEINE